MSVGSGDWFGGFWIAAAYAMTSLSAEL